MLVPAMLVPCRCDCHTDPLPYCDECCDGPVSLHEQLEATEAKLAEALNLAEKIELQRQAAESREKALREAALELCVAAAEAFVVRGGAGRAALPALVARVRSLVPGEIGKACGAALAAGKEMDHGHVR